MELLQHFSHQHPLLFFKERSHESDKTRCSGCGELVSGPSYGCVDCKFYLDKQCAEAPSQLNHPFHRDHSFHLLKSSPYTSGSCLCDFCYRDCNNFVYHCSCGLDLDIKCALFSCDVAGKRTGELQHIARIDPLISTENKNEEMTKAECFACWKPLLDSVYFSPDCGFQLHVKCADLPPEINHPLHPQHPLVLQFNSKSLSCKICPKTQRPGFVYCCSLCDFVLHIQCVSLHLPTTIKKPYHRNHPLVLQSVTDPLDCQICQEATQSDQFLYFCSFCKFGLHIGCVSQPPIIEDKTHHDHPLTLLQREFSFECDACGTLGYCVPYICSTCNIMVHKKCISLPRFIKFYRHRHPISHTYSIDGFEEWACRFCHDKVNTKHGSYFCSKCNYIVHVNCVLKSGIYEVVSSMETDEDMDSADEPMESIEYVTGTSIKHFLHDHLLAMGEAFEGDKQCDACVSFISGSYYYCLQCDFFLHQACAKEPRKNHLWFHHCLKFQRLTSGCIFRCTFCYFLTNGFRYYCDVCKSSCCLRCALVSDIPKCEGHEHALPFYMNYEARCHGCGSLVPYAHRCKSCNFDLCYDCLMLPVEARHKFDEHPFKLTYHDNNDYAKSHVCDICEKERNPNHWFYHCATCDNSAHPKCVRGKTPYIKPGSIYKYENHPHPLTFVQKVGIYPDCSICGDHCVDLSLECKDGCSYVVHWDCIKPRRL